MSYVNCATRITIAWQENPYFEEGGMNRRVFLVGLLAVAVPALAEARGGYRPRRRSGGGSASGGVAGGYGDASCGRRGGPGWRKANGKCAGWRD